MTFDPTQPFTIGAPPSQPTSGGFDPNQPFTIGEPTQPPSSFAGQEARPYEPTLGERFVQNASEAARNSLMGRLTEALAVRFAPDTSPIDPNTGQSFGATPRQQLLDSLAEQRGMDAIYPSFADAPTLPGQVMGGAAALAGGLAGGFASPEGLIPVGRAFGATAGPVLQRAIGAGIQQAGIQGAANVLGQGASVAAGTQAEFSPEEAVTATAMGAGIGGLMHVAVPAVADAVGGVLRNIWERVSGTRHPSAPPLSVSAPPTEHEVIGAITSDDVNRVAVAAGIDPLDPGQLATGEDRLAALTRILEQRRQNESAPPPAVDEYQRPPSAPPTSAADRRDVVLQRIDAQVAAEARGAAAAGRPYDAEASKAKLLAVEGLGPRGEELPPIQVTPSGQAIPMDAEGRMTPDARSTNQGLYLRGNPRSTALVPIDPPVRPMDNAAVAHASAIQQRGEGKPAANQGAPSNIHIRDDGTLRPWDTVEKPTPPPEGATIINDPPPPSGLHEQWTTARDNAARRAQQLTDEAKELRNLRGQRLAHNPASDPSAPFPGTDRFAQGPSGARALDAAIRGKENGASSAAGRQRVAEAALRDLSMNREPPFAPRYPNAGQNAAVTTAPPQPPRGIIRTIQEMGGIRDVGGDAKSQGLQTTPGLINNQTTGKRVGQSLDQIADGLADRGFFPDLKAEKEGGNARTLNGPEMVLDAIRREQFGEKVLPPDVATQHADAVATHDAHIEDIHEVAAKLGLKGSEVRGLTKGQLADYVADRASVDQLHQLDHERAAALEASTEEARQRSDEHAAEHGQPPVDWEREASTPRTLEDLNNEYANSDGSRGDGNQDATGPDVAAGRESAVAERENGRASLPDHADGVAAQGGEGGGSDAVPGRPGGEGRGNEVARDPLRQTTEGNGQAVLPGAEASTKQAIQARDNTPMRGKTPQAGMEKFDLFDPHARDQNALFDAGAKAAATPPAKLYSGPGALFDPDVWKFMFGPIKERVLQPWVDSFRELSDAFGSDRASKVVADARTPRASGSGVPLAARAENALSRPARQVASFLRATLYGDDSAMRAMGDRLPPGARAAMHDFLDLFHARAGEARAAGRTFHEGVAAEFSSRINKLEGILGADVGNKDTMGQLVKLVQSGRANASTPLGKQAIALQGWLADALKYQRAAGLDVGQVKVGYFPRRLDPDAVFKNEAGFLTAAAKEFRTAGHEDPAAAAQAWLMDIKTNGANKGPVVALHDGLGGDHLNGRTLGKTADATLREFLVQDPARALVSYAASATRRAEFARVMGKDNAAWTKLTAGLSKDGAESILPRVADYVATAVGAVQNRGTPGLQKFLAGARVWGSIGLMDKSAVTSASEIFGAGARSGNLLDTWRQAKTMIAYWAGRESAQRITALSEDIGTVVSHLAGSMASSRWVGDENVSAGMSKVAEKYFRAVGLEQWSHGMNVAATNVADLFVRRMSADVGAAGRPGRTAAFSLAELGIPAGKHEAFARWLNGATDGGKNGMDVATLHAAPPAMREAYSTAVFRFTRQTHMQPTAATRPRWASSPLGSVAFHLSNYAYAVHTNIIMRAVRMTADGNLTGADKAIMAAKIATGILMAIPAQVALGEARSAMFDSPQAAEKYPEHRIETAIARSGSLGAVDPWFQLLSGMRYHKDIGTSLAGPAGGRLLSAAGTAMNYAQGTQHTNDQSRQMAQALYDAGLKPAANFAGAFMPLPIAAAIAQVVGSGARREEFVSNVGGPAPKHRKTH